MKAVLKILLIVIIVVSILFLLLLSPFIAADFLGRIQNNKIRNEIFEYVLENKDEIELTDMEHRQYFEYTEKGFIDSGIIYGYFYSPHDEHQNYTRTYRNGYLRYGSPNSGEDWCYFEKICDNWYYYEEHYG